MRSMVPRTAATCLVMAVLAVLLAPDVSAHESRQVDSYEVVVGWADEPTYTGFLNAVQLFVDDEAGEPVAEGVDLTVEVSFGDETMGPLELEPVFDSPGEYQAPLVPTRAGPYTFRFVGTIAGQEVDESFTASETTFAVPAEASEIAFPVKDPAPAELADRIERVDERAADAAQGADNATGAGTRGTILGALGLVAGLVALGVALTGRRRA